MSAPAPAAPVPPAPGVTLVPVDYDPFADMPPVAVFPATHAQREIWLSVRMGGAEANLAFNESVSVRVPGALDAAALQAAAAALVARHESLRATFSPDGVWMCIAPPPREIDWAVEDLSAPPAGDREARRAARAAAEVETPFDLQRGPLIRFRLLTDGAESSEIVITAHHIVCDGWAIDVLVKELGALYVAARGGPAVDLPPAPRYAEYARLMAHHERSAAGAAVMRYWRDRFTEPLEPLDLPLDAPRPARRTFRGERVDLPLPPALAAALRRTGARLGCSLVNLMLAAFKALLYRLTGQADLAVGLPSAGQSAMGQELLVGHCVNLLPLRTRLAPDRPFAEAAAAVRATLLDAYDHQHFTFGRLLEQLRLPRDPARIPLLPVAFNMDQGIAVESFRFDDRPTRFTSNPRHYENFEWFLNVMPAGEGFGLEASFNRDLFAPESVRRWLEAYLALLAGVAEHPEQPLAALPLLDADTRRRMLEDWSGARTDYPREASLASLFEARVAQHGSAPAVVVVPDAAGRQPAETLSYTELNRRANRLAHHLIVLGVRPDDPVGICLERGADLIVATLGVLKAGGAYVPLDPAWPRERLAYMLSDTAPRALVTASTAAANLPPDDAPRVRMDADAAALAAQTDTNPGLTRDGNSLAYLMYTSGSTGRPKGVAIPQRGVARLVCANDFMDLGPDTVMLQFAPAAFDAATLEIWGPLLNGGRVVMAPPGSLTPEEIGQVIRAHGVNALWLSAELFRLMVDERLEDLRGVRQLLAGGDVLPVPAVARVLAELPDCRLINGYGPTENTTFTCCHDVRAGGVVEPRVPIGRPVANTTVYLLDAGLQPVPVGVPGELYTGGDGLARGYWNRPELDAERFVPHPFAPGERLYRTGDRARWRADGAIDFLGRADRQIKVRGFRVEPGEIETLLAAQPAVAQAVVGLWEPRPGDRRLVAHLVPRPGQTVTASELRAALRRELPAPMIPQHLVEVPAMPVTPTGKIDRRTLPPPFEDRTPAPAEALPTGPAEKKVAAVWRTVLGVETLRATDNFFDLGGHSLLAIRAVTELRRQTGVDIAPNDILFDTLRQLTARLLQAGWKP